MKYSWSKKRRKDQEIYRKHQKSDNLSKNSVFLKFLKVIKIN